MLTPDKDGTNDKDEAKWKDGAEFVRVWKVLLKPALI